MIYKILKKPFFGSFMVKWRNPLPENEKKEWQKFSVKSKSGGLIQGMFAKTKNKKAKGTIVLGHPMGKEAKGYFLKRNYTILLRENGFNIVIFDINGFGESSNGNFSYFEDITVVSIKTKELTPDLPIGYHGISLGAMFSTISFADVNHKFDFAIIESSATSLADFWIQFPFAYKTLKFFNFLLPKYKRKIDFQERIKEVKHLQSILYIYSESDNWVPVEMGKKLQQNTNVSTEFWLAKDAQHAEIMKSSDKETYQERILEFFNQEVVKYNA
jgi:predicted alpha/beta-fold hydrolase